MMKNGEKELDYNLFVTSETNRTKFAVNGTDHHSQTGDPKFVDASIGDFRISEDSPAWEIGFHNFEMDNFGVRSKKLKGYSQNTSDSGIEYPIG